ncbi:MAG: phosphotransferase [Proteobacteria bacterium]|nr:phosphotransferase [Pseudomonadota bacterium]
MLSQDEVIALIKKEFLESKIENTILEIIPLTQDMSLRRYFRLLLQTPTAEKKKTMLAMYFDSVKCPEVGGGVSVNSDVSFVELANFFNNHSVAVPVIYHQALDKQLLFLEDLGNKHLADLLFAENKSTKELEKYFALALDQIVLIQKIPLNPNFFAYQRGFNETTYVNEMMEIVDYTLQGKPITEHEKQELSVFFKFHAGELLKLPKVLSHRDFHAWNLIIENDQIRIIDFQDALISTRPYDLVSLINDRDVDSSLGVDLYKALIRKFITKLGVAPEEFYAEYDLVLLQRDLKVAGRLAKMVVMRGLTQYAKWIPGTLTRIGNTLARINGRGGNERYNVPLTILSKYLSEVETGGKNSYRLE